MKKISQEQVNTIITYLDRSTLPHTDVVALIKLLIGLPDVEVKVEVKKEINPVDTGCLESGGAPSN